MFDVTTLDKQTRQVLERHGFDSIPFSSFAERLRKSGLDLEQNRLRCPVELPPDESIARLPEPGDSEAERVAGLGRAAIEAGEVGVVVLNGGMATRFGGVAKGIVPAVAGRSFLDLKLSQVSRAGDDRALVLLMNSFATDEAAKKHVKDLAPSFEVRHFTQMVSLRLTRGGDLFQAGDGKPSLHAPGHGDLPFALRRSGELDRFVSSGGRYLTVSNVDNLAAGLDPRVIGMHIDKGAPMTVELVRTYKGDVGGSPLLVDGKMAIVEAFRMPRSFDVNTIPVFNTNTFVFDAAALTSEIELAWFAVSKKVESLEVVQFERLVGQLTEFVDVTWLLVPREGPLSRFIPIKVPDDLDDQSVALESMLREQGVL